MNLPSYVLITPARDEGKFIESTIQSVVAQTVRPKKWVIVNDGSTDNTAEIVKKYAMQHPWIELVQMPARQHRNFAGKVHAFNAGYARVQDVEFDAIASLDADITFDHEYFAFLLGKLVEDRGYGLVGTPFIEDSSETYDYRYVNIEHVSGACQLFRRECFQDIGGYIPIEGGCIDHIAVVTSRMKGWKTRTFTEKACYHHRAMGTAQRSVIAARFRCGRKDYAVGNHPVWEVFRGLYQLTKKPYLVGGLAVLSGYVWSYVERRKRPASKELIMFQRAEQMQRLRAFLTRRQPQAANPTAQREVKA
jgi:biofilm PGA synthesis N-glycosyltransferase PgaC